MIACVFQEAKVGRAIVLTTHSMEEADILGEQGALFKGGGQDKGTRNHVSV